MKKILGIFLIAITALVSCSKNDQEDKFPVDAPKGDVTASYTLMAKAAVLTADNFPLEEVLCKVEHSDFTAGQNILAGHVYVGNDDVNLYLQISSTEGFQNVGENVKVAITTTPFTDRPAAGHFTYKYDVAEGDTVIYLSFPLAELGLTCDAKPFYITVHGDVLTNDEEEPGQTAFGGPILDEKPWWGYITYAPECCPPENPNPINRVIALKSYYNDAQEVRRWVVSGNAASDANCLGLTSFKYVYWGLETDVMTYDLYEYWQKKVIGKVTIAPTANELEVKVTLTFDAEYVGYEFTNTYVFLGTSETLLGLTYTSTSGTWINLDCVNFMGFPYQNATEIAVKEFIIQL